MAERNAPDYEMKAIEPGLTSLLQNVQLNYGLATPKMFGPNILILYFLPISTN